MPREALHPALAYHVVNTLGWPSLRPFQQEALGPVLRGEHVLLLAPTAGGKTEAAIFPLVSKMLGEDWRGLSVIYLCPIKALLNDLEPRLSRYLELVGRRAGLWHGDVAQGARRRLLREPPDLLLTTPESIEAMLVSRRGGARTMLSSARAVIVDEIHAFAGDDRGHHLLAVLHRVERLAGRRLQRIGLSATVGNTEQLLDWLAADAEGPRRVLGGAGPERSSRKSRPAKDRADVQLDFVGSLDNAALVISRLHGGEKRLVFCDSRARVERLAMALRASEVRVFVSHSSLSREERHLAERAFAEDRDCVIVATSTLELGLDIGDLDRVIQIDSPPSVASMLQRMGRTGRRPGSRANFLVLATSDDALLRAAGLLALWAEGFVEPVSPPPRPLHLLAQQIMALALEQGGVGRADWQRLLLDQHAFADVSRDEASRVLDHMVESGILSCDQGILWFGAQGEATFGRRNFLEILGVIAGAPRFLVFHGSQEIGSVDQTALYWSREGGSQESPTTLLLAGRAWRVEHIAWNRRRLYVEPTRHGRPLWIGEGRPLGSEHTAMIGRVLAGTAVAGLSRRAAGRLDELRLEHPWLGIEEGASVLVAATEGFVWWTFGGFFANQSLLSALKEGVQVKVGISPELRADDLRIRIATPAAASDVAGEIEELRSRDPKLLRPTITAEAIEGLKFSQCLPAEIARSVLEGRASDLRGLERLLSAPFRVVGS